MSGSGRSLIRSNALAGDYTITFAPVPYYTTPAPETKTLAANVRIASTNTVAAGNTFDVYMYNGAFNAVDNDFYVIVTGRKSTNSAYTFSGDAAGSGTTS